MTTEVIGSRFDMGRIVRRTFSTVQTNLVTFGVIALLLNVLPQFINGAISSGEVIAKGNIGLTLLLSLLSLANIVLLIGGSLVSMGALTYGAVAAFNGRTLSVADCLKGGASHWWRIFVVLVLVGVLTGLSILVFVIPAFILMVRWYVAVPVQIIEGLGARASMGRSAQLTKGHRWAIFGLLLAALIIVIVIELTLLALVGGFAGGLAAIATHPAATLLVLPLIQLIFVPLGVTFPASIYYELTGGTAGSESNPVAAVFD